jgi:transposase
MDTMPGSPVVCGIDTHADTICVAACDRTGRVLGTAEFPVTVRGHQAMFRWASRFGEIAVAGVEGTSSYGRATTEFLTSEGVRVTEVIRPNRQTRRRLGKSDPADAIAAARAVLSGEADAIPKTGNGPIEDIRVLQIARSSAIRARTRAANQIRDLIITAPLDLRQRLRPLTTRQRVEACARFRPDTALKTPLRILARRHQALSDETHYLTTELTRLVTATAPTLIALKGVGPDVAAKLLIAAGGNPHRIRTEAAFAALCGASPIDASSGLQRRHRLNRGGNRQANNALWRIALVRMSTDPTTRAYVQRRSAEGRTKPEIIRCLKRYIARQTHHAITHDLTQLA